MGILVFFIILFVVLVGGGWFLGKAIGSALFTDDKEKKNTFIDKSVHHHFYDNRTVNMDGETYKSLKK